jgi:diacylglycerol O-acyltransferase
VGFREPMRRVDAAWLRMDRPENTADIVALLGLAEPLPFARVRTLVEERLLAFRRFCQRIHDPGVSAATWEDDPGFSLVRHLDRVELPGGPRALREHLGRLASTPFAPGRPPWRMQLLDLGRRRSALAVKLHHCLGDGRALVKVLAGLADGGAALPAVPSPAFRPLDLTREPIAAVFHALAEPARALALAGEAAAFGSSLARLALLPLDRTPGLVRPLTGIRRLAWTPAVTLAGAVEAGHRAGTTPNELVVAAIAGGLRRVLPAAAPDGAEPRALVPVDARSPGDGALGNAFGLVFLALPTTVATPADRLAAVRERFARIRESPDAAVTLAVLAGFGLLPAPLEHLGTSFFSRKASLVVTNVRGPAAAVRLAGAEVERMMFWVPHPATLGLGISILSYAGTIRVGVRADQGVLADPTVLAAAIAAELESLGVPADAREARASRRRPPRAARWRPEPIQVTEQA